MESQRNKAKFLDEDGFIYVFDKHAKDGVTMFWRCERRSNDFKCNGRIHVKEGIVSKIITKHNHDGSSVRVETAQAITRMKKRALETSDMPLEIINTISKDLSIPGKGAIASVDALKKSIRRKRIKHSNAPLSANLTLNSLDIPLDFQLYETNEDSEKFLLGDSGPDDDRILIFGRESNLNRFKDSTNWFVDGTFKIAPRLFSQVF